MWQGNNLLAVTSWTSWVSRAPSKTRWELRVEWPWQGGVFYTTTWTTLILPKGSCLCESSRWERRGEKRLYYYCGTHARYLYIRSVMLCGTVQLWQWCHLCVIYDECLLIQCMWLMQPLSGAIQYVMDQSQIDLVYQLMGQMLSSLMSNSQWPVGLVNGLQFNKQDPLDWSGGIPSQFWHLGCCNHGKLLFSPSRGTPGLPQGAPSHQIHPGRMLVRGNHFFRPDHTASRHPLHILIPVGCSSMGNISPATPQSEYPSCDPLSYLFPLCRHLYVVNKFNCVMGCESRDVNNCE